MHLAQRVGRYFGYRRLTFQLDRISTGRLAWVSVLPLAVVVALAVQLIAFYRLEGFGYRDGTIWVEAFWIADIGIKIGIPLSLAVCFAAGLQKWSRAAGSWMLMIGLTLVMTAAGLGAASIALVAANGVEQAFEFKVQSWTQWSASLAFLAVGYFYLAYRAGLNRRPRRRFVRHRYFAFD